MSDLKKIRDEFILKLKGNSFIIDENTCSIYFENLIKSKFKIKKKDKR